MKNEAEMELPSVVKEQKATPIIGILSLIAGIISILCCCVGGWIEAILGVIAIVLGIITLAKKKSGRNLGIAGIITGIFGLVLGIVMTFVYLLCSKYNIMDEVAIALTNELYEYDYYYNDDDTDYKDRLYGTWIIDEGPACYILNNDGSWGWYKDYNDLSDNYYEGSYMEILNGQEALEYYGMDMNEQEQHHIVPERFFCLKLYIDTFVSNGNTTEYDKEGPLSIMIYFDTVIGETVYVNMNEGRQYNIHQLNETLDD